MKISVIITTAPGREENLSHCLEMLTRQTASDFEVIVADDGSVGGHHVVEKYADKLDLSYLWRVNDCCVSRSRNLAVAAAKGTHFVFTDGDVLLEPRVLALYQGYFQTYPETVITGYFGGSDALHQAPSLWIPGCRVNYLDQRIAYYHRNSIEVLSLMKRAPYHFFWSGNCGLSAEIYRDVGGFDERYRGWGYEDTQFALDFSLKGYGLLYALDLWCEHQVHPRNGGFYQKKKRKKVFDVKLFQTYTYPELKMSGDAEIVQEITRAVFEHYHPQDHLTAQMSYWHTREVNASIYTTGLSLSELIEQVER